MNANRQGGKPLDKLDAIAAPTTSDDAGKGYSIGSHWVDATNDKAYVCLDATGAAAVWTETTGSGGGGAPTDAQYVALATDATLTDERVLTAGDGIGLTDAGAGSTATLRTTSTVFFTAVSGSGTVDQKTYEANTSPSNKILTGFQSDNDDITLTVEIHGSTDSWHPADVTVSGGGATPVQVTATNWTQIGSTTRTRIWTASVNLTDATTTGTITATMSDGDTTTVSYTRTDDRPAILSVQWDNQGSVNPGDVYPDTASGWWGAARGQSAFKNNDDMKVSGTCDTNAVSVYIKDAGATNGQGLQGPFTVTAGVFDSGTDAGLATVQAGSGNNSTAHLIVYAAWGGTDGDDFNSETDQAAATVVLDNDAPSLGNPSYDYNVGAVPSPDALRDGGTCEVTCTASTYTDVEYECTEATDLTVASSTTYASTKTWTHNLAYQKWWDSTDGSNAQLKAFRDVNGKTSTKTFTIEMEIDAAFTVSYPGSQVCLGDGDNFTITGSPGGSTNVTDVRFNSQNNNDAITQSQGSTNAVSAGAWSITESTRNSGLGGSFSPTSAYGYIEVKIGGSWRTGRDKRTDDTIQADTDTVPTFNNKNVSSYPATQTALKANETASARITHTNPDIYSPTYAYDDGATSDFTPGGIPSASTYAEYKTVTLQNPGVYRVSGNNYQLTVTQSDYNGLSASTNLLVKVADVAAVITLTNDGEGSDSVFRSRSTGGNKVYTITASCNQDMNEITIKRDNVHAPVDNGTAMTSPMGSGGPANWTETISIAEADQKNSGAADNYNFQPTDGTNWGKNIANFATTAAPADVTYWVAGFESRTVYFDTQYQQVWPIGTMVSNRDNAAKMDPLNWGGLFNLTYVANANDAPGTKTFTVCDAGGAFDADGTNFRINDTNISGLAPAASPGTVMFVREDA